MKRILSTLLLFIFYTGSLMAQKLHNQNVVQENEKNNTQKEFEPEYKFDKMITIEEENPEPEGGMETFYTYIGKELKLPKKVKKGEAEGKVFVEFYVDLDGTLSDIEIVKGIDNCPECNEEVIRILTKSNKKIKWIPGKNFKGETERTKIIIPIIFRTPKNKIK